MIKSVEEFVRLRSSDNMEEYNRAAHEEAPIEIWEAIISEHEDMKKWVIHNKTVPLSILEILSEDPNPVVRHSVATKRKLNRKKGCCCCCCVRLLPALVASGPHNSRQTLYLYR